MKTIGKTWNKVERQNSGLGLMWQKDTKRMWCVYKIISTHFLIRISRRFHLAVSSLFLPFLIVDSPTPWHTAMLLRLRSGHQTRGSAKSRRRETCLKLCWITQLLNACSESAQLPTMATACDVLLWFSSCRVCHGAYHRHFPHPAFHSDLLIGSRNHNYITLVQVCTNRSKGNVATRFSRRLNVTFEHSWYEEKVYNRWNSCDSLVHGGTVIILLLSHDLIMESSTASRRCERRRISGNRFSSPKNNDVISYIICWQKDTEYQVQKRQRSNHRYKL